MKRINLAVTVVMLTAMAGWGCAVFEAIEREAGSDASFDYLAAAIVDKASRGT